MGDLWWTYSGFNWTYALDWKMDFEIYVVRQLLLEMNIGFCI